MLKIDNHIDELNLKLVNSDTEATSKMVDHTDKVFYILEFVTLYINPIHSDPHVCEE